MPFAPACIGNQKHPADGSYFSVPFIIPTVWTKRPLSSRSSLKYQRELFSAGQVGGVDTRALF
jgi:hypothetical protein